MSAVNTSNVLVKTPVDVLFDDTKNALAPRKRKRVVQTTLSDYFTGVKMRLFGPATDEECGETFTLDAKDVSADGSSDIRSCNSSPNKCYQPLDREPSNTDAVVSYSYSETAQTCANDDNSWPEVCGSCLVDVNAIFPESSNAATAGSDTTESVSSNNPTDVDDRLCSKSLSLIKAVLVEILQYIIEERMKELCNGCKIDHPSQRQHTCLYDPDSYFFRNYYNDITKKLYTAKLKPIVSDLLKSSGIQLSFLKIQGCIETIVCELVYVESIFDRLQEMRTQLYEESMADLVNVAFCKWFNHEKSVV